MRLSGWIFLYFKFPCTPTFWKIAIAANLRGVASSKIERKKTPPLRREAPRSWENLPSLYPPVSFFQLRTTTCLLLWRPVTKRPLVSFHSWKIRFLQWTRRILPATIAVSSSSSCLCLTFDAIALTPLTKKSLEKSNRPQLMRLPSL